MTTTTTRPTTLPLAHARGVIKMTVNIHRSIESCPHSAWLVFVSQPICRIISATWDSTQWYSFDCQTLWSESCWLVTRRLSSTPLLPAMASDHSSMTYELERLKNRWVYNLLAMYLSARTYWQWAGPIFHSLLSAHHLTGAYFLTTESDRHMHLLTRLYGS